MSYVFDQDVNFYYIYRYVDGAWDTNNYASSTAFDLFSDTSQVDDAIYFGRYNPSWAFHNLTINVGTALIATNITVVWEYTKNGTWTTIPSVTDNTNAFQNTGSNTVLFDVPENMAGSTTRLYYRLNVSGSYKSAMWIRCRITAVSGITEGGRTTTDKVKAKDWTITVNNENVTLADIQSASDSGSWLARTGVNAVDTIDRFTIIRPTLYLKGTSTFTETRRLIIHGEEKYPVGFRSLAGAFKLGELDASGRGKNGCMILSYARFDAGYDYIYNLEAYASIIDRKIGDYGAWALYKNFQFIDSVFNSDRRWYLASGITSGSNWKNSLYADPDLLYLYNGNIAFNNFKSLDGWSGVLCGAGNPATLKNTNINGKKIMRYYSSNIDLIDCTNIDKSNITSTAPSNGADRHVRIKYTINYKIIDKDNNPVVGATVTLKDTNGDTTFSVTTGSDGTITEQTVMVYDKWWEYAASWALHEDDYNDFSLEITYGKKSYKMDKFTIDAPINDTLQLQNNLSVSSVF